MLKQFQRYSMVEELKKNRGQFLPVTTSQADRDLYERVSMNYKEDVGNDTDVTFSLAHDKEKNYPSV